MNNKTFDTCINCGKNWIWESKDVQDFNKPAGKRVWPAICNSCKTNLEGKYKEGKITKTELMLEFSSISAKIAKRLTVTGSFDLNILQMFKPTRRGKN